MEKEELKPGWYYLKKANWAVGRLFYVVAKEENYYHVAPTIEIYTNGALYDPDNYYNTTIEKEKSLILVSEMTSDQKRDLVVHLLDVENRVVDKGKI